MVETSRIIAFILGGLVGLVAAYLILKNRLQKLQLEKNRLEASYKAEMKAWEEKMQFASRSREEMTAQFRAMAEQVLEEKGRKVNEAGAERLNQVLEPFNRQLKEFKNQVEQSYHFRLQDSAQLKTQLQQLTKLNQQISQDALNLTNALKGQSQTQGIWGEMILERVLEQSGLVKGEHYETQVSMQNEERQRFRPDAIIHLPGGKDLVIDAKVSLSAYETCCSTQSPARREEAVKAHLRSVRSHLKELDLKDYSSLPDLNTLDLVLMFIPVEGAFALALQEDRLLFSEAFDKRIVIVSPTTLFATLRTVENSWRNEAQNRNAQEIAGKAGKLYDKFCGFLSDMDRVEKSLDQAGKAYYDARNKLSDGKGNLIRRAQDLKDLGARTQKNLPEDLIPEN